eukprot:1877152-Pleurochrysis_carterae.AAC.10
MRKRVPALHAAESASLLLLGHRESRRRREGAHGRPQGDGDQEDGCGAAPWAFLLLSTRASLRTGLPSRRDLGSCCFKEPVIKRSLCLVFVHEEAVIFRCCTDKGGGIKQSSEQQDHQLFVCARCRLCPLFRTPPSNCGSGRREAVKTTAVRRLEDTLRHVVQVAQLEVARLQSRTSYRSECKVSCCPRARGSSWELVGAPPRVRRLYENSATWTAALRYTAGAFASLTVRSIANASRVGIHTSVSFHGCRGPFLVNSHGRSFQRVG